MYNFAQKLTAEFLGTFALVFYSAGAVCIDWYPHASNALGPLGIALVYGLSMAVLFAALGHISGGHFNPAVTISFWVTKRLNTIDTVAYWIVQLLGAIAAAYLLKSLVPEDTWRAVALGTPMFAHDFTRLSALILEGVTTFFVVLTFFATTVDARASSSRAVAGFAIGITLALGNLLAGPFTGGALNPARAFGPALASSHWQNHGTYWVGPLIGGFVAGFLYDSLFLKKT
ncbi:MAG TPA: MIP family channel protein [Candidatus Acidoferrum sp.]|nr:MIP family channel protein [Candidatus Acidoferrum sp.]